ncbi:MAG: methyltransferase domain-containing protein [Clostridiales bacterium]|nr:methyltransferase domain-containing protein [Clostridiales bacterium]
MTQSSQKIKNIYSSYIAWHYDLPISNLFGRFKKKAFNASSLKKGDKVLVFCCGTGLDFPAILNKIGQEGKIVGVDFSSEMLSQAQEKVEKSGWDNVELIEADVTTFKIDDTDFDAGVCTLGLSIMQEYKKAYDNLISYVKKDGEIIIGDAKLASGAMAVFNPLTVFMGKSYGGSFEGHRNSLEIIACMEKELNNIRSKSFFFGSYYYCIGSKN